MNNWRESIISSRMPESVFSRTRTESMVEKYQPEVEHNLEAIRRIQKEGIERTRKRIAEMDEEIRLSVETHIQNPVSVTKKIRETDLRRACPELIRNFIK